MDQPQTQARQELLRGPRLMKKLGTPDDVIIQWQAENEMSGAPEKRILLILSKSLLFG